MVITGKGVHTKQQTGDSLPKLFYGKIKNSIISWIKEEELKKYILTYQDAGIEHGGDGAIFVYLRKKDSNFIQFKQPVFEIYINFLRQETRPKKIQFYQGHFFCGQPICFDSL